MRIRKREEHLCFPSAFKKWCLVLKDYIQCGSGPPVSARSQVLCTPSTGGKIHRAEWLVGRPEATPSLVPKPKTLSPVVSATSTVLISSSPHASRGHSESRYPSSPAGEPAVPGAEQGTKGEKTTRSLPHSEQTMSTSPFPVSPSVSHGRLGTMSR